MQYKRGDFPGGSDFKESVCNAGDLGSIPGSERSSGKGNGNPLQYSCLENPMDRGAWWATVHGVAIATKPPQLPKFTMERGPGSEDTKGSKAIHMQAEMFEKQMLLC